MKRKSATIALFTASSLSSSWFFLSHAGLGSPFTTSLYKTHNYCRWRFVHTWAIAAKMNETGVKYVETGNSQNENIAAYSYYNLYWISNSSDQRGFFNTMECDHRGKGEGKWGEKRTISYFYIEVFLKEVLSLLHYEDSTFMPTF